MQELLAGLQQQQMAGWGLGFRVRRERRAYVVWLLHIETRKSARCPFSTNSCWPVAPPPGSVAGRLRLTVHVLKVPRLQGALGCAECVARGNGGYSARFTCERTERPAASRTVYY